MFDWDRFKKGEIAVHCDTEEKAKDFLKECKNRNINWCTGRDVTKRNYWEEYKEDTCYCCFDGDSKLGYADCEFYISEGKEILKWKVKELTFKEVIANIKDEQVWDDGFIKIEKICGSIRIGNINGEPYKELIALVINECRKFKLQRKEYTFEEAFKAYESGKEIESCEILCKYKNGKFNLGESNPIWLELRSIPLRGIRGKWYIND